MIPVEVHLLHEGVNINIWKIEVCITILFDNTEDNTGKAHV